MGRTLSSPQLRWALLLMVAGTAVFLRFWQLGNWPPGLYRDEAYNGLDALRVLAGEHAIFFPANNGREPAYIYLAAGAIALLGQSVLALRLGAALLSSVTTLAVYGLAREWFGQRVGLLAAALWAITLWPVHLGRIGLRAVWLPLMLALIFWLGTRAYRTAVSRQRRLLWLATGLLYGAAFYTYLAVRFTPILLAAIALYELRFRPGRQPVATGERQLNPESRFTLHAPRSPLPASRFTDYALFALGTAVSLLPLGLLALRQPELLLGRAGQVSVLDTAVNGGDLWGTLLRQIGAALGMFFGQGDTILRHNPAGRPVFDPLMALPFLIGVGWCLRHWRRPPAAMLLLWTLIMLGPTILAADAPHFLRAVGVLPAAIIFPALGLAQIGGWLRWRWPGIMLIGLLLAGSTAVTVRDYVNYSQDPQTAYLFEQAARSLAEEINREETPTPFYMDERYWSGWPSLPFLLTNSNVLRFTPEAGLPTPLPLPARLIVWPYEATDFVAAALPEAVLVRAEAGPLARGDLEPQAYPLYAQYWVQAAQPLATQASFGGLLQLQKAQAVLAQDILQVDTVWTAETAVTQPLTLFVHVIGPAGLLAQDDAPIGNGYWPAAWWRPGLQLQDRRTLALPSGFDPGWHQVIIGLYDATQTRLPVSTADGQPAGDSWRVEVER